MKSLSQSLILWNLANVKKINMFNKSIHINVINDSAKNRVLKTYFCSEPNLENTWYKTCTTKKYKLCKQCNKFDKSCSNDERVYIFCCFSFAWIVFRHTVCVIVPCFAHVHWGASVLHLQYLQRSVCKQRLISALTRGVSDDEACGDVELCSTLWEIKLTEMKMMNTAVLADTFH